MTSIGGDHLMNSQDNFKYVISGILISLIAIVASVFSRTAMSIADLSPTPQLDPYLSMLDILIVVGIIIALYPVFKYLFGRNRRSA